MEDSTYHQGFLFSELVWGAWSHTPTTSGRLNIPWQTDNLKYLFPDKNTPSKYLGFLEGLFLQKRHPSTFSFSQWLFIHLRPPPYSPQYIYSPHSPLTKVWAQVKILKELCFMKTLRQGLLLLHSFPGWTVYCRFHPFWTHLHPSSLVCGGSCTPGGKKWRTQKNSLSPECTQLTHIPLVPKENNQINKANYNNNKPKNTSTK